MAVFDRVQMLGELPASSVGAEVGVQSGRFMRRIIQRASPKLVYAVDSWSLHPDLPEENYDDSKHLHLMNIFMNKFANVIARGQVRVLCGDSAAMAKHVKDGELDWVYIDAGHTYKAVRRDAAAWMPKVRVGGIVAGHDYYYTPPARVPVHMGVVEAVADITRDLNIRQVNLTTDRLRSWWFVKPSED